MELSRPPCEPAVTRAEYLALLERVVRLEAMLSARNPRDAQDAALRLLLPASTQGLPFTSSALLEDASTQRDPELVAALLAADLVTAADVGCWLRSQRGQRDGVDIRRKGRRWLATYTSCT